MATIGSMDDSRKVDDQHYSVVALLPPTHYHDIYIVIVRPQMQYPLRLLIIALNAKERFHGIEGT